MSDTPAPAAPLKLFNSLTRQLEEFQPVYTGEARVYSCGPTVYNYPHIGNMRAYVFADILGRTLSFKGYKLTHVINITDVGHLTDDADAGEDKMEKMAAAQKQSIWDIAEHYKQAYWADVRALNIRQPAQWTIATDYVPKMIEFAKCIADKHCYETEKALYFNVNTVKDYGLLADLSRAPFLEMMRQVKARLASAKAIANPSLRLQASRDAAIALIAGLKEKVADAALPHYREMLSIWQPLEDSKDFFADLAEVLEVSRSQLNHRIEPDVEKQNDEDFAIWRKTPPGESRQMEWDSPWGKGAPGWHLECSVMSREVLGFPFDIHTGGIDHREIHHPNEIAQNQAFCCAGGLDLTTNSGARMWMHNNFLVERSGKMSKSSGEFLRLQLLIDKGYHPLAYRMMCLQAHYRSELEFSWDGLAAALTRLKRMLMAIEQLKARIPPPTGEGDHPQGGGGAPSVTHDGAPPPSAMVPLPVPGRKFTPFLERFESAVSDDLNTPVALTVFEEVLALKKVDPAEKLAALAAMDAVLGLGLLETSRADLRIRPKDAAMSVDHIEASIAFRRELRAQQNYPALDRNRDELADKGVEVMDGDPLGWEWKL
ncbi:cysteine--tRNA ligase [Novosphingobium sp.]|uniref:cysteine--tRNA ligase n=1 Tax=Novosphingobium sp. TaxID=1874826 RepID=UPI002630FFE6|nr:cysteine--tRNA ligase [Novosphingobium sp.]